MGWRLRNGGGGIRSPLQGFGSSTGIYSHGVAMGCHRPHLWCSGSPQCAANRFSHLWLKNHRANSGLFHEFNAARIFEILAVAGLDGGDDEQDEASEPDGRYDGKQQPADAEK